MTSSADRRANRHTGRIRGAGFKFVDRITPITNRLKPFDVFDDAGVLKVHKAAMRLLKDVGILVVDYPSTAELFKQHGAIVEARGKDQLIKIDEDTLMHFVRMAPATFTQLARDPAKHIPIGGNKTVFAPVYGPPFVMDLDNGRRQGTIADFQNFSKLSYMSEHIHHNGGTLCEPNDVDVKERHLDMLLAHILYSDKAFMGSVTHKENARDTVAMCEILFGAEQIRQHPATISLVNASSPMRYDDRMFGALEVYARARQAVLVTPFMMAGAMTPVSVAASLAQQNAEALFGIAYCQMLNPGTPVIYGSFFANIDLRSGAPCFGTPEDNLALYGGAQLARHYNLPFRSGGNFTASRIPDAQSGYESANTLMATMHGNVNFVLHAAGWLEGGLISGYEKFVLDHETLAMAARLAGGISLEDEEFAWDAYEEVEPGGHFLGSAHTIRHYETAFYQHSVFNMDNFEKWEAEGSIDSYKRANGVWKRMLADYQPPTIDAGKKDALLDFVARRRAEIATGRLVRPDPA